MRSIITTAMIAVLACWPMALLAQTSPAIYQSPFSSYVAFNDEPVGDWRKLNAAVAEMPAEHDMSKMDDKPKAEFVKPAPMDHSMHGKKM